MKLPALNQRGYVALVLPLSRCWIQCCSVAVAVWRTATNSAWYSSLLKGCCKDVLLGAIIWYHLVIFGLVGWLVGGFKKKIERHQGSSWQKRLNIAKPPLWHQAFQTGGLWQRLHQRLRNIPGLKVCSQQHILLIKQSNEKTSLNIFAPDQTFAHAPQILRQYNVMFLSPKDERKHWLYAVILTLCLQDWGFRVYNLMVLGFRL